MLKLRRLRVERFRSLTRQAELAFSDGVNVLLGQNGAGKTALLELISMVVRSDFSSLAKEAFAIEYELAVPEGENLIVIVQNDRVATEELQAPIELGAREVFQPSAEVLGGSDRRRLLHYDAEHGLSIGDAPPRRPVDMPASVDRSFVLFLVANVPAFGPRFFHYLVQAGTTHRLDEALDLFRTVTGTEDLGGDILIDGRLWLPDPFAPPLVPYSIVEKLMISHEPQQPGYSFKDDELVLLVTLKDVLGFSAAALRVDVTEQPDPARVQIGNLAFRFWREDGTFITHERLGFGQKRLVALFYYLACNPEIAIADELVNGLDRRWITAALEAIDLRQAFLTSQHLLVLDFVAATSAAEVQRSFVFCRGELHGGPRGWRWENMGDDAAQELFSAFGVGVEYVSKLLQSRGLW